MARNPPCDACERGETTDRCSAPPQTRWASENVWGKMKQACQPQSPHEKIPPSAESIGASIARSIAFDRSTSEFFFFSPFRLHTNRPACDKASGRGGRTSTSPSKCRRSHGRHIRGAAGAAGARCSRRWLVGGLWLILMSRSTCGEVHTADRDRADAGCRTLPLSATTDLRRGRPRGRPPHLAGRCARSDRLVGDAGRFAHVIDSRAAGWPWGVA